MKRWIALLATLLANLVGFLLLTSAIAPSTASVVTYTHGSHHASAPFDAAASKRGPPVAYNPVTAYDAVDRWPHGASARQNGPAHSRAFAYDHAALHVQGARDSRTTRTRAAANVGGLSSPERSDVAANAGADVSQIVMRSPGQLQSKFKHAGDFGVTGNYSKANAANFSSAIHQHINAAGTRAIQGTYRGESVTHYLDPATGLNVISRNGEFVSGWQLSPGQLANVLKHGGLGGG